MSIAAVSIHAPLLAAVRRVFNAHATVLFIPDEAGRFVLACVDCPDGYIEPGLRVEPGKGLVGWILRHRQPLIVNNFDQHTSHIGYYALRDENGVTAFMGCPLPSGGVLCVDTVQQGAFGNEDLDILLALAALLTPQTVIPTADTEDLRRYFSRLDRIQELRVQNPQWSTYLPAFLRLVAEATRFDYVAFASRPDSGERFTLEGESSLLLMEGGEPVTLPLAGSVAGWVFRNDVPVHTEGIDGSPMAALFGKVKGMPEFQSVICLPVTVNRNTSAVLCLGGIEPRQIPQALRSFIRMAVDELVQFLEALYLRHRVSTLMPKARVHRDGAMAYNPDSAPSPLIPEDD